MKKLRGFTLVECLVALAVLGIASLIMAQIYANVSYQNRQNHQNNASLASQMQYVEKKTNTEAIQIKSGEVIPASPPAIGSPPPVNSVSKKNVTLTRKNSSGSVISVYGYAVDYYVLMTRDADGDGMYTYNDSTDTWTLNPDYNSIAKDTSSLDSDVNKNSYYLNYKYFTGFSK